MTVKQSATQQDKNIQARALALAATEHIGSTPTGIVSYQSGGRLIVIGAQPAQELAHRLGAPLQTQLLLTEGVEEPGVPCIPLAGRSLRVDGYLGHFVLELGESGHANHERLQFDMVLDLSATPLIRRELNPPGYWYHEPAQAVPDDLIARLSDMCGRFEKPRYFSYQADLCAHARAGQLGCDRCIRTCPAEAIISIGEKIEVNPNLCQGGGICASVCPSGAIRYAYPSPSDTLERLRQLLLHYRQAGGVDPSVLFVAEADAPQLAPLAGEQLLLVIEELASVGCEIWLAALAWGAKRVILLDGGSLPDNVGRALNEQIELAQALLAALGYPPEAIALCHSNAVAAPAPPCMPALAEASLTVSDDKRRMFLAAVQHLIDAATTQLQEIALPPAAPFGKVVLDGPRCTLCMACASVCPSSALSGGDATPRLHFKEEACLQCGICVKACPEQALGLQPRLLIDPAARQQRRLLHEEAPFCCLSCGKPFASHSTIDRIIGKLGAHPMFRGERAMRRLQMCEDCRVVDIVQDAEVMQEGMPSMPIQPSSGKEH